MEARLAGLLASVAWILYSMVVRSPETADCTDWLTITCRAATGDAVVEVEVPVVLGREVATITSPP